MAAKKKPEATSPAAALPRGLPLIAPGLRCTEAPSPLPPSLLDRLRLPNGEPISPSMRALLAVDGAWLRAPIDEEDAVFEVCDLDEAVVTALGEEAEPLFEEAYELLGDDCIVLASPAGTLHVLYVGNADAEGEYPVITCSVRDGAARVSGFAPFDVWLARLLGVLTASSDPDAAPDAYRAAAKDLARRNGDGRADFRPEPRDENDD